MHKGPFVYRVLLWQGSFCDWGPLVMGPFVMVPFAMGYLSRVIIMTGPYVGVLLIERKGRQSV
jgi:hypothetical protein